MLDLHCFGMTGRACDEEFAGVTMSARVSDEAGYLGILLRDWNKELRIQTQIGADVEAADEFDEDGTPQRKRSRAWSMLQPIQTPGGVITASAFPPGGLKAALEAGFDPGTCGCVGVEDE